MSKDYKITSLMRLAYHNRLGEGSKLSDDQLFKIFLRWFRDMNGKHHESEIIQEMLKAKYEQKS